MRHPATAQILNPLGGSIDMIDCHIEVEPVLGHTSPQAPAGSRPFAHQPLPTRGSHTVQDVQTGPRSRRQGLLPKTQQADPGRGNLSESIRADLRGFSA